MRVSVTRNKTNVGRFSVFAFAVAALIVQPLLSLNLPSAFAAAPTTHFVSGTGIDSADCSVEASPCLTIQHAVDQAASGDKVSVAAGDYNEDVTINDKVSLEGAGASSTTIIGVLDYTVRLKAGASETKISGFTLKNNIAGKAVLKLETGAALNTLYITGNHFISNNAHLIYAGNVTNSNFTSNTFYVNGITNTPTKKAGVYFEPASNGNTFKNNKFVGSTDSMAIGVQGNNNIFLTNKLNGLTTSYDKVVEFPGTGNTSMGNLLAQTKSALRLTLVISAVSLVHLTKL